MVARSFDGIMFSETVDASWAERARRGWFALTSFGLQAVVLSVMLLLPLLRPAGLPMLRLMTMPVSLGRSGDVSPIRARPRTVLLLSQPSTFVFRRPVPTLDAHPEADDGPPAVGTGPFTPGAGPIGDRDGIANLLDGSTHPVLPVSPPPVPVSHTVRLSHMSEGDLIRKVQPNYPPLARSARIQGTVLLQATIGRQGNIENLQVVSGHPMLAKAALDAVRQWRYRPYILNGEPVEVETQITVKFSLGQ